MNKPFLLLSGHHYYPESGTGNWIARFANENLAKKAVVDLSAPEPNMRFGNYVIDNQEYDWFEIVNLETWEE